MTYTTYIPKTTYAQRHQKFLAVRKEARRSLSNCRAVQGVLLKACDAKLSRNYIDVPVIEGGVQQIVEISNVIRGLRPVAEQPDPPRHEPVTETLLEQEARIYGGVKASRLVRVLHFIRRLKRVKGETIAARRLLKMSNRLINGLDIYKRVKTLVAKLIEAVDAPETAMTPRGKSKTQSPRQGFNWEVSPQGIYGWKRSLSVKGYDPRQTSVYWLEKQSMALRRAVYRDYHGIETASPREPQTSTNQKKDLRTYIPPQGAQITDQIWPPIDLVRMIEERRVVRKQAVKDQRCFSSTVCGESATIYSEIEGQNTRSPQDQYLANETCAAKHTDLGSRPKERLENPTYHDFGETFKKAVLVNASNARKPP